MNILRSKSTSLMVFGIYMMLIPGAGLMIAPGPLLDLFGLRHGDDLWMAGVIGMLVFGTGIFQVCISKYGIEKLYLVTVGQRYFAAAFFVVLWARDLIEIPILLLSLLDIAGATWTLVETRNNRQ